jgi:3-hydroxyacyl-CoA dehydrogenase
VSAPVRIERHGEIAVVVVDQPPVNALSQPVRAGLLEAVEALDADPSVAALVIHATGRHFIAGADIREFDQPPREPCLHSVLRRLEDCGKPVIAALHGAALGGGLELALAGHDRCATHDVKAGLPEVKLGLLPGSGGTLRLPRLIGVQPALELMLAGEPLPLERLQALGIVDHVIDGDVKSGAIEWARTLVAAGTAPRRLREQAVADSQLYDAAFFANYRTKLSKAQRRLEAVERILLSVEAGLRLPFEAAEARTRELFDACRRSTQSAALRHLFFAERGARIEGARPVHTVGIVGAGTMGSGIAISLATSGYAVVLVDASEQGLVRAAGRIGATLDAAAAKGRMTAAAAREARARVRTSTDFGAVADAELVIEAVFEKLAVKREVFARLDGVCKPGAVLATNTSTLDVDAIAAATGRPGDVVGMHFFSPANIMRLVEVVRGGHTRREVIATALAVTRRLGKVGVVVGNGFGFVGNRMLYGYGRENQLLLLEGAPPERIDAALEAWGMAMGPNAVGDLAGLDIGYSVRRERTDLPDDSRYYRVADLLAERGWFGQKTGRGIYRYEPGDKRPRPDPEVAALIEEEARRLGVARRAIEDTEIVERCVFALVNEGARLLEEGVAASPQDIDVIWCNGYGFPRERGGPMFHADSMGPARVLETIRRYEREQGPRYWQPAPLIERLAAEGLTFGAWHARRADAA